MKCACIDADVDERVEILSDTYPKANKEHICGECMAKIHKGQVYHHEKTVYDRKMETYKTCLDCDSVRQHLVCSFYYGHIWGLVTDSLDEFGDDFPWVKIGKLTPLARERICGWIEAKWEDEIDD